MNSVNNNISSISYQAANIGVLTPPDHIKKYKITDYELENKFRDISKDVYSKQKTVSFENRKKTPTIVKILLSGGFLVLLWHTTMKFIRK